MFHFNYKQALLTAKLASKEDGNYLGVYRNYAPMQMFLALAETDSPEAYIHPVLDQIRQYDHLHKTEYYKTLRLFCLTMQNKDSTSIQLAIHRNTLLYRLNRMRDLFNVTYEDEQTALHLLVSFLLIDIMERFS
ncbi:helix-turn-helix domain-containing protein [Niallia sp. XMNu-256]|uniref:PucR family transcriptional regulator n=1 Tax=Niallia sp. XMNu-256 TaxID=3082444 RepID=UPI0030D0B020